MTNVSEQAINMPTGTVTFLFTDIEGSTALFENYPVQMDAALKRHDEILSANIKEHWGYVFKTVGDQFCAAFSTAREALEATLASQRALFAEEWPENTRLRVRMGLHTGVAEEREGDYFGPPVNRVARLMSAGHGGQVLVSDATYNLVRDVLSHLEPGSELRYLGEHQLRDLRFTERIFQLVVPDLPEEFPPLKTRGLVQREAAGSKDRYRRKGLLGSGGMAEVYLARDEKLDRDVALKVLSRQYAKDEQFVERFEREAKNAAALTHSNIVSIYDRGETQEGAYYIAMECVAGGTLKDRIEEEGPLPLAEALSVTLQVAKALAVAHRRGVIHRDIKPQNVLLTELGEAKVADFGIAKSASWTGATRTGMVMGTPHYMSPEQVMGELATPRSDLYSLGVVLYEMLTGELPYYAETPIGVLSKHLLGQFRSPKEINPKVPERVNAVVMRLMAKDPEKRYPDADALIEDLERMQRGERPTFSEPEPDPVSKVLDNYREAVEMVSGKKLDKVGVDRLNALADQLGLSREQAADVERRVLGDSKEGILLTQYRRAVEMIWTDGRLNRLGVEWLGGLAGELGLSRDQISYAESEIMGATKEEIFRQNPSPKPPVGPESFGLAYTFTGHSDEVNSVAFSPDGQFIASGSSDGTIRGWDARTGRSVGTLAAHSGKVSSVIFSPDEKLVASGGFDKAIRIWKLPKGESFHTFDHSDWVFSVAISPNNRVFASGGADREIKLWDLETGGLLRTLTGHSHWVLSVVFAPDGQSLASSGADKTVRLWEVETGELIRTFGRSDSQERNEAALPGSPESSQGHADWVWSVAVGPDGRLIASGGEDGTIRVWDSKTGELLNEVAGHSGPVLCVGISPDGQLLFSGGSDRKIKIWNPRTGELLNVLSGHLGEVGSVAISPDGQLLVSGGYDHAIKIWRREETGKANGSDLKGDRATGRPSYARPDSLPDEPGPREPGRPPNLPDEEPRPRLVRPQDLPD